MTATATPTDPEPDRRNPGDGKLNPFNHIVRIVRLAAGSKPVSQSGGSGHSHETGVELTDATAALKKMPAPSSGGTSTLQGSLKATSSNSKSMLDVLKPTDIVVVGREPASVLTIHSKGKEPTLGVFPHDEHNKVTVLRVWTESDTIEYQCDEPFAIVGVKRAGWKIYDAPDNPFGFGEVEYIAQERKSGTGKKSIWVWKSGLLPASANNQQYKATFKIDGQLIDPDIVCGNPPPN